MSFPIRPDEPTLEEVYRGTIDPLPRAEERELVCRYQETGDEDALDRLVRANVRFVISTAKKFQGGPLSLTELVSEGNLGLLTAIDRFNTDRGLKLISYAVWWIRQAILQALSKNQRIVRTPSNFNTDRQSIKRVRWAARVHSSSIAAAETLGCIPGAFGRVCRKFGIETPKVRQMRLRKEARERSS